MYFDEFVNPIINNNIDYLLNHPEAKYNFVESIYLHMWWEQATDERKKQLLNLIGQKRWEIQMGGWVMNDQACPTYSSSIDQLTHGHVWLKEAMNVTPVEGFTLDPFGQTPTQAYLYSLAGFQYTAQWRIPYTEMMDYESTKSLEFWWQDDNDIAKPLFTHILDLGYYGPGGFNFWSPGSANPAITPENIKDRSEILVNILDTQASYFMSEKNLLMMWGGDFAITRPDWQFGNTSLLIDYINKDEVYSKKYHLQYTTASEYFSQVSTEIGDKIKTMKNKDFFVYDDNEFGYWSGYYTSQPRMKLASRLGERVGRAGEFVYSSAYILNQKDDFSFYSQMELDGMLERLKLLRAKNGQILHHDAITGTEKWHVSDFYVSEQADALDLVDEVTRTLFSYLLSPTWCSEYGRMAIVLPSLIDWQVNYGDEVGFFVYNSLGWPVTGEARVFQFGTPVGMGTYDLKILKVTEGGKKKQNVSSAILSHDVEKRVSTVVFDTDLLPAAGFQYYIMEFNKKTPQHIPTKKSASIDSISNGIYTIAFDAVTNKMSKITTPTTSMDVTLDFEYYTSYSGGFDASSSKTLTEEQIRRMIQQDPSNGQNSGAYIFRPVSDATAQVSQKASLKITENDVFVEARQTFDDYIDVGIRLYNQNQSYIELVYYQVGVIPPDHEVVVSLKTPISNKQVLYHDELALDMKRKPFTKKTDPGITAAANHFPTQYATYIKDSTHQLTVVSSKSGSSASMEDGKLEIMIHRSCSADDSKGVNQPLLDKYVITESDNFRMRISLDDLASDDPDEFRHKHSYRINYTPELYPLHPNYWNVWSYPSDFKTTFSMLVDQDVLTPNTVHLLSMNKVDVGDAGFVLRLNHLMGSDEPKAKVESVEPSKLLGQTKKMQPMKLSLMGTEEESEDANEIISLKPIQILTYLVEF